MLERVGPAVAAVVIVAALAAFLPRSDPEVLVDAEPPEPLLLEAYERSRSVEAVVESVFTRTASDGRELSYEQRLVQRPPDDRLVIGAGTASGRIDGRIVRCTAGGGGEPTCLQGGDADPYADEVAREVRALASLVDATSGIYEVDVLDSGCFRLGLRVDYPSPPYGDVATFCFDEATGVLSSVDVERPEAHDRTEAVAIRTEVTAEDLRAAELGDPVSTE